MIKDQSLWAGVENEQNQSCGCKMSVFVCVEHEQGNDT